MARRNVKFVFILLFILFAASVGFADEYLEGLKPDQAVHGFKILSLYENGSGQAMGARFVSEKYGFIVDLLRIQSVPQAFFWIKTPPTSSKGEPHTCEHLLLGKGNRGRYVAAIEDMTLSSSTAYTAQTRTCYHFNTIAGEDTFYQIFEAKLQALLHPDFSDEEIRREVHHLGVVEDPQSGELSIEEKGTVYTEMVSALEKPWDYFWGTLNRLVYGKDHPLSYNSGGHPEVMRSMEPDDLWSFHKQTHHLANMGAIVSVPSEIAVDSFLEEMVGILERSQEFGTKVDAASIRVQNLPPPRMAEVGTVEVTAYPSENPEDPGYIMFAWPSTLKLTEEERFMLELFLETFSSGQTSNLYNAFINSQTRKIDIGGNAVFGGIDDDLNISIYFGLVGVRNSAVEKETLERVKKIITEEIERIYNFTDGSEELVAFNQKVIARLVQNKKQIGNYLNSPPMFGFRSGAAGGWISLLLGVEKQKGFRRSLVLRDGFAFAEKQLESQANIWKDYIDRWKVLTTLPYTVGAAPDPGLLKKAAEEKRARLAKYTEELKRRYEVSDAQQAIAAYKEEFDGKTAELEEMKNKDKLPEFIPNPPLSLDGQLEYETVKLPDGIEMVASTFEVMSSSMVALALRMDVIPEPLLLYVPLIPDVLTNIGVIKDGEVVPYDKMRERLRQEVLSLNASYSLGMERERVELVLTGRGSNLNELKNVIGWMDAALFTPYLSTDNLSRMQDVVNQSLISYRNIMKGSEESWVQNPARAYRFQSNPLFLATSSFLTEAHFLQRIKWMLTFPADKSEERKLVSFLNMLREAGRQKDRNELASLLASVEQQTLPDDSGIKAVIEDMSESSSKIAKDFIQALKVTLNDIPDKNLSQDWDYLCTQAQTDLVLEPEKVVDDINQLLILLRKSDNVRSYMISNSNDRKAARNNIERLIGKLDSKTFSVRQTYPATQRIIERMKPRKPELERPVYVGLVFEGTRNGVLLFSARNTGEYDTEFDSILECLAGKLYSGGGPHGLFMQTWAAGLAYSNGYSFNQRSGWANYYAERCPDVAETMRFVVEQLKMAGDDPGLADYAVAQVFGRSRAPSRYEQRGAAMAADLTDGFTPEKVKAYRKKILEMKEGKKFYEGLKSRMEEAYGSVLIGYGKPLSESKDGVFFLIGPDPQFVSLENYIASVEGKQPVYRLYPRDFWITN